MSDILRTALETIAKMKACRVTGIKDLHDYACPYCTARAALAADTEYNSGSEDCAICHKTTQNGVWGCDHCWDEIKLLCGEFLRLRASAAFDQAHGLRSEVAEPHHSDCLCDTCVEAYARHPDNQGLLAVGPPAVGVYSEIVTLNGRAFGVFVDRAARQIFFRADVVGCTVRPARRPRHGRDHCRRRAQRPLYRRDAGRPRCHRPMTIPSGRITTTKRCASIASSPAR